MSKLAILQPQFDPYVCVWGGVGGGGGGGGWGGGGVTCFLDSPHSCSLNLSDHFKFKSNEGVGSLHSTNW